MLYRRADDDDYSFYDSHLAHYDDDDIVPTKPQKSIRLKGMFARDSHYEEYKEQLHQYGYALVDDVIYNAASRRELTEWALYESKFELNTPYSLRMMDENGEEIIPAFELQNDVELANHHFYDDHWDSYYSFDDDHLRGTLGTGLVGDKDDDYHNGEDIQQEEIERAELGDGACTRASFARLYRPTCNEIHHLVGGYDWLIDHDVHSRRWKKRKQLSYDKSDLSKYLGHGYYRDAFLYQQPSGKVVFKTMRHMYAADGDTITEDDDLLTRGLGWDPTDKNTFFNYKEEMRKDAMVMELLSSSPHAINLYSHCAMSSFVEFAPLDMSDYIMPTSGYAPKRLVRRGDAQNDELDDAPLNDHISPEEKLDIALGMAKSLEAMHGYSDGAIAHGDIQVGQFFQGNDGRIKLVDYNRAEPLLYDIKNEKYCKWMNDMPPDGTVSMLC